MNGTPPVRPLFFEFPNEPELFGIDQQFLVGRNILVTPVLTPNASTVDGIFPGRGRVVWRDWYTGAAVNATVGGNTTLAAPLGHLNVHVRDGAVLLLHATPAYTTTETAAGPYALLVALARDGYAQGQAYVDDGTSDPPGPSTTLAFAARAGALTIAPNGKFAIAQPLANVTLLGVATKPTNVAVGGHTAQFEYDAAVQKLVVSGLKVSLNSKTTVTWA
jgi:alpha-glucosidase